MRQTPSTTDLLALFGPATKRHRRVPDSPDSGRYGGAMGTAATAEARARAAAFAVPRAAEPGRVVVALSGGVDSAVAAWLLTEAGHEVTGVSLRLAPDAAGPAREGRCCSVSDLTDARQLCDRLGIPFYAVDARDRFKEAVLDPFVAMWRAGVTPIPCLACNHEVKFGDLYRTARGLGARLATGHYAQLTDHAGHRTLARPVDDDRDQTYYLYGTPAEVVQQLELPLGGLDKPLVRALAERAGIAVHDKPDSQEICFVPDGDHAAVVERLGGPGRAGRVVDLDGRVLREHDGVHRFTVGQRRRLGVSGPERLFVVDVDGESGDVVVATREHLGATRVRVRDVNAIVPEEAWPDRVFAQVRARHRPAPASVTREGEHLVLTFEEPVFAVELGQAAVVYADEALLGGGLIDGRLDGDRPRRAAPLPVLG
jgi:tRNA-specific 2-thiouridylase